MANSAGGNVVALGEHARLRGRAPREEFADDVETLVSRWLYTT